MSNIPLPSPSFPRLQDVAAPADPAAYRAWEVVPAAWPELPYRIMLPLPWNREDDTGAKPGAAGEFTRLGLFADVLRPDAAIVQISCWKLPIEVATLDWINFQADAFGVRVISARLIADGAGQAADVIAWYGPQDNRYAARVLCRADGGFIFTVLAMAPTARYESMKDDLALALASFNLQRSVAPGQLEKWITVEVAAPDFKVAHPSSWTAKPAPAVRPGKSGIELLLCDGPGGAVLGYVRLKAVDPKVAAGDTETLFRLSHEEFTEGPVSLSSEWEEDKDPIIANVAGLLLARRARGKMNTTEVEVRTAVIERGPMRFCAGLISVPQSADALVWMRTKGAYAIVLRTAGPAKFGSPVGAK